MTYIDARPLRAIAAGVAMMLLYGSRLTHGAVRQTPQGEAFPLKPMFAWSRAIGLPAYVIFYAYTMMAERHSLPWYFSLLLLAAIFFGIAPMPGTITLTGDAIVKRYWLMPDRTIPYNGVARIELKRRGRRIRIVGENGTVITHTVNHSGAQEFRRQLEQRTGKQVAA